VYRETRKTLDAPAKDNPSGVLDYQLSPLLRPRAAVVRALSWLLCLAHLLVLSLLARRHPFGAYATETDFYHLFAPDAERLLAGQFPLNTFQAPGYPAVLALLGKLLGLSGDLFTVGKWLSVVCAVACGWLVFKLFAQMFGVWVGLGAQALAIVSGEFPQFSIAATTDVFFLFLCLATLVVFTSKRLWVSQRLVGAAVLASFSYLTRYNGLFLLATCLAGIVLLNLFELRWRERWRHAALFLLIFLVVASPWFYFNAKHRGSPLYNTNYLNLATEFYPELAQGEVNQDATRALADRFRSFGDVLRYDPARLLKHYPVNLWQSLRNLGGTTLLHLWVAWAALGGLLLLLREHRSKTSLTLVLAGMLYLLLMGLNHWETRYYFFIMALGVGLAVYLVVRIGEVLRARGWLPHAVAATLALALWIVLFGSALAQSGADVTSFLANHPLEVQAARGYLQSQGVCEGLTPKRIVARKPHLPYLCRSEWVFFPQVKTLDELRDWLGKTPVDYLLISQRELKERKTLKPLGNPAQAPAWLRPVWSSQEPPAVLYRPELTLQ
jgi:hypothetical protein